MMKITRSKKNKTTVTINPQTSSYEVLPLELVIEIIGRLPVKSIARFLLVSKLWATIIRSRDFIKSFPLGSCSSSQPQFLIAFNGQDHTKEHLEKEHWYFFSSSFLSRSCPIPNYEYRSHYYVNGLLCIGCGQKQFIVNPTTGKSIALPRVRTKRKAPVSYFGYDSVSDQYKVLCMTEAQRGPNFLRPSSQHQVFTLEAKKRRSWRMLECRIPHRPLSYGVCVHGVIYYMAKTGSTNNWSQLSLMSFDLRSEKFGVSPEIPITEVQNSHVVILNFQGKVAITTKASTYTFDVWVMDEDPEEGNKWLMKLTFSVEPWNGLFRNLYITGMTQTGEFILAPYFNSDDVYVGLYNHYTDTFRKIKVQGKEDNDFKRNHVKRIFSSDYIENVRLL
ncbi:hypothetical protein N665_1562s0002 [Sinapis alba]|nr:hypothetical protein N665_1562s0002 [Sinapis alba]